MIETTSEFKKAVKTLVKGAIKSKVFGGETNAYTLTVSVGTYDKKEKKGTVSVGISAGPFAMCLADEVNTRVYNKINDEFFAPIVEQFSKLKGVNGITFAITAAE